ncbi:MAG: hypothetical protein MUE81_23025, partial [Thermoflexibacter sp.]|nr:hypothetical protein [Thermoflexibacter sp.]
RAFFLLVSHTQPKRNVGDSCKMAQHMRIHAQTYLLRIMILQQNNLMVISTNSKNLTSVGITGQVENV